MSDGDITAPTGDGGAEKITTGESANGTPKWFETFASTVDKRFEGLAEKLRAKDAQKPANGDASKPVSAADIEAAYELGVVAAGLSDAAREHLHGMASQGATFSERLAAARLIKQFGSAPARDAQTSATTPLGKAATSAPRSAPAAPTTQREWIALKRAAEKDASAKVRFEDLLHDDKFDPYKLPVG